MNRSTEIDHLGILAPDFPPRPGGMEELARGLAEALTEFTRVTVFTTPQQGVPEASFRQSRTLSLDLHADVKQLQRQEIDAWLALNAGLMPLAKRFDRPFFVYLHGNDFLTPWIPCGPWWLEKIHRPYAGIIRHRLRRMSLKHSAARPRLLLTNSRQTARLIEGRLGVERDRILVCPPGVDEAFFRVSKSEKRSDELRVLTVARLSSHSRRKNVDGVLRALNMLKPKFHIRYEIVGGGDDLPRLRDLTAQLGLGDSVSFRGQISREDLLRCYSEADLFILASKASKRDVEGFGIVYLEASAAGVPVICSAAGGAVDAVQDGENGLLIPDSSPQTIARGVERFLKERSHYTAQRVRAFAEGFRWDKVARRVYSALTGREYEN